MAALVKRNVMFQYKMDTKTNRKSINLIFNLAVLAYLLFSFVVDYIFTPETEARVPWDYVFEMNPMLGSVGAVIVVVILISCGTYIIQHFWNRFIADVFNIREILFQEALSIMLIIGLLSIG